MGKVFGKFVLSLLLLLVLGLAAAYVFRLPLVEALLKQQLNRLGVEEPTFTVEALSVDRLVIRDLELDVGQSVGARELIARWSMDSLLSGTLSSLFIEGLRISLDLSQPLPESDQVAAKTSVSPNIPLLPDVNLADAKVFIRSRSAVATLVLDGGSQSNGRENSDLSLSLRALLVPGIADEIRPTSIEAPTRLEASLHATVTDYRAIPSFTLELNATGWQQTSPSNVPGNAHLNLQAKGTLPAAEGVSDRGRRGWQAATFNAEIGLRLKHLSVPEKVGDLGGQLEGELSYADGRGLLVLNQNNRLDAAGLDPLWLAQFGAENSDHSLHVSLLEDNRIHLDLADDAGQSEISATTHVELRSRDSALQVYAMPSLVLGQQLDLQSMQVAALDVKASNLHLAGQTLDHVAMSGNLAGMPGQLSGDLETRVTAKGVRLADAEAGQLELTLPVRLRYEAQTLELSLSGEADVRMEQLTLTSGVRLEKGIRLKIPSAQLQLTQDPQGYALEHVVELRSGPISLLLNQGNNAPLKALIQPQSLTAKGVWNGREPYSGSTQLNLSSVTLPQYQVALDGVKVEAEVHGEQGLAVNLSQAGIRHLSGQPLFQPMVLTGQARLHSDRVIASADLGPAVSKSIHLKASHSLASGKGQLEIVGDPVAFSPGELQPLHYFPDTVVMQEVSGNVALKGQLKWSRQGVDGVGQLQVEHWSFKLGETAIIDLTSVLQFNELLPPRSPAGQTLSIRRIDAGIPFTDFLARYRVEGGDSPRLVIEQARVNALGGQLLSGPATIDPSASGMDVTIDVQGLNLENLFTLIEAEGLTGSGLLDGRIPLTFQGNAVSVSDGRLAARSPGIIRVESQAVADVLGGRVENVDLLIEALTEFHYSDLTLSLNNSSHNDMVVNLSMLGNNPKVLGGRLFRLNINLQSNISKILDALAQAFGLSNQALQRALRLH